jgi:phosphoribosyl 1,2-cyclic phosphate phosphodiesterase
LIDTSTDFRAQALREGIDRLDAVVFTHSHADHLHGLDDTRSLTHDDPLPLFASEATTNEIRNRFDYIFRPSQPGGGKPRVYFCTISEEPFEIGGVEIVPIPLMHGGLPIFGYRVGRLAYITDCSQIEKAGFKLLKGVEVLVVGALRYRVHPTHFTVEQAIDAAKTIGSTRTILTHLCHDVEHSELAAQLPEGFEPAYDGLTISV